MAVTGGTTFLQAKSDLATVTDNGVCADDPRVMARANEAIFALLAEGIWIGTMATYDIVGIQNPSNTAVAGTQLWLPPELENVIEHEVITGSVLGSTDINQGWSEISGNAYADPAFAHDSPLIDLFDYPDTDHTLRRLYDFPGLTPGGTVRVTGVKRYRPIINDDSYLLIQNIRAIKLMILSIEREENNAPTEAAAYKASALELLQKAVARHRLDPKNTMKRKARYQADLVQYSANTLGRIRAKLALELPNFLNKGKSDITYLINRALEALVRRENLLRIASKWDVHGDTVTEIVFTLPVNDASTALTVACPGSLAAGDYDIIKRMCQFFLHSEAPIPDATTYGQNAAQISSQMETEVYALLEARLAEALEFKRRTIYETALASLGSTTAGYFAARLGLDLPGGLKMSQIELLRMVNTCEQRLMERGKWKGTITELRALVNAGYIFFPRDVEAILAATMDGTPVRIRNRYFEFHENTTGEIGFNAEAKCASLILDQGDEYSAVSGSTRRKYKVPAANGTSLHALVKRRWILKASGDTLVIQNYEAIRLVAMSILSEADPAKSGPHFSQAIDILQKELQEHLAGIMPHIQVQVRGQRRIRMLR